MFTYSTKHEKTDYWSLEGRVHDLIFVFLSELNIHTYKTDLYFLTYITVQMHEKQTSNYTTES